MLHCVDEGVRFVARDPAGQSRESLQRSRALRAATALGRPGGQELQRGVVAAVGQCGNRQRVAEVGHHPAVQEFDRGHATETVGHQVVQRSATGDAHLPVTGHHGLDRFVAIELELDPLQVAHAGPGVGPWVARAVKPHQLDNEPGLVHSAAGKVAAILVEGHAAVAGLPTRGTAGRAGPTLDAALIDHEQALSQVPVVVLTEHDGLSVTQAEGAARSRAVAAQQGQQQGDPDRNSAWSHRPHLPRYSTSRPGSGSAFRECRWNFRFPFVLFRTTGRAARGPRGQR